MEIPTSACLSFRCGMERSLRRTRTGPSPFRRLTGAHRGLSGCRSQEMRLMNARVLFRPLLAGALALVLACGGADAYAGRRRPVIQTPAPAVAQWNHDWARGAVFYEIFVRSFADSNADGIGDFNGLISRLDYLNDGNPATTTDLG